MDRQSIIDLLVVNHTSFIDYINKLGTEEFLFSYGQKWNAGQQLAHIVLCVKPLVKVLSMEREAIEENFGITDRPGSSYEVMLDNYKIQLGKGGKAPDRFVPEAVSAEDKVALSNTLAELTQQLCDKIKNFTEHELDTLCIPHPLLGSLSMREMLYNAIQHVQHHHEQTRNNLKHFGITAPIA